MAGEPHVENAASPEGDGPEPPRRRRRSARLGRAIATSAVVAILAYLILSGLVSVIPQIFWPERATLDPSVRCEDGLRDLRAELLARASDHVGAGGAVLARSGADDDLSPWLHDWDRRHLGLEERCTGEGADAHQLLGRLRERLESSLDRYDSGEADLDRDLSRALAGASTSTLP